MAVWQCLAVLLVCNLCTNQQLAQTHTTTNSARLLPHQCRSSPAGLVAAGGLLVRRAQPAAAEHLRAALRRAARAAPKAATPGGLCLARACRTSGALGTGFVAAGPVNAPGKGWVRLGWACRSAHSLSHTCAWCFTAAVMQAQALTRPAPVCLRLDPPTGAGALPGRVAACSSRAPDRAGAALWRPGRRGRGGRRKGAAV